MNAKKLIFNPSKLKPVKRVDRPKGASVPADSHTADSHNVQLASAQLAVERLETQAYWRGFADGAREMGGVRWLESEVNDYYKRTKGF